NATAERRAHRLEHRLAAAELDQEIHVLRLRHGERIRFQVRSGEIHAAILRWIADGHARELDRRADRFLDQALALAEEGEESLADDPATEHANAYHRGRHRRRRLTPRCEGVKRSGRGLSRGERCLPRKW